MWDSPSPVSEESPGYADMCAGSTEVPSQHHPEGCAFLEAQGCSAYGPAPGSVPVSSSIFALGQTMQALDCWDQ